MSEPAAAPVQDAAGGAGAASDARARQDEMIAAVGVGVWYCDLPFDELRRNATVKSHFWLPPDARVTIDTFYARLHPDDREPTRAAIAHSIGSGQPYDVAYRTVAPPDHPEAGQVRWVRAIGHTAYDAAGQPVRFDGVTVDVTAQKSAEARLAASEQRYELASRAASNAIWDWDLATDALTWSVGVHAVFGYAPGTVPDGIAWWYDTIHPDDRERVVTGIHAVIDHPAGDPAGGDGRAWRDEYRFRRGDGRYADVVDRGYVVRDAEGRATRMIGAMEDVTARRAAEAELREAEQRFRALVDAIPQLVWSTRADGYHDFFNERWYEFTGMPRGELGWDWKNFLHPDDVERALAVWGRSLRTGEPYAIEYRFREAATGAYRWFIGRALPLRDAAGRITRWFGTCTDIEDQKRAESAARHAEGLLRASAERTRFLGEASTALAGSLDVTSTLGRVVRLAVPALADYCLGYLVDASGAAAGVAAAHRDPAQEARAALVAERHRPRPDDPNSPLATAVRTTRTQVVEVTDAVLERTAATAEMLAAFRALAPRAMVAVPLVARERVLGAVAFVRVEGSPPHDEREVALAEELCARAALALDNAQLYRRAQAARAEAEEANRAKSEFLARMSHDLRTPLNAIGGYAQLVELGIHGPVTDAQVAATGRIRRAQEHLLTLINDILSFAKLEAGQVRFDMQPIPLRAALADAAALVEPQARAKGLRVEAREAPETLRVRADPARLQQVLANLLGNAVKYTEPGGRLSLDWADAGAGPVRVLVRDTGRGIAGDRLEAIFDPFVQLGRTPATESQSGVGLGLAIARELARAMGGRITVESEPGVGSTFTVELERAS